MRSARLAFVALAAITCHAEAPPRGATAFDIVASEDGVAIDATLFAGRCRGGMDACGWVAHPEEECLKPGRGYVACMSQQPNNAECAAELQQTAHAWFTPVATKLAADARSLTELFSTRAARRWVESVASLAPRDVWTPFTVFLSPAQGHDPDTALVGDVVVARVTGDPKVDFYVVARGIAARVFDRSVKYLVHDIEDRDLDGLLARSVAREVFIHGAAACAARASGFEPPSSDPFIASLATKLVDCAALRLPDAAWTSRLIATIADVRKSVRPKLLDILRRANDSPIDPGARDCGPPAVIDSCDPCDDIGGMHLFVQWPQSDCAVSFDLPKRVIEVRSDVRRLDVDMPLPDCERCCIQQQ